MLIAAAPLARLRRSALGAWLACVYALATVATMLSAAPALAAIGSGEMALLCSGERLPTGDGDQQVAMLHCLGCPANPAATGPVQPPAALGRGATFGVANPPVFTALAVFAAEHGRPQPRGPPAGDRN